MNSLQPITQNTNSGFIQMSPITLNDDYAKKWNVGHYRDFMVLTKNGKQINESLYRIGGLSSIRPHKDIKEDYVLILKYVEDFYSDDITKIKDKKPHLKGLWCILDKNGIEKKVFESILSSPYLLGGVIYVIDSKYYNIETGEFYCQAYNRVSSEDFLFLENSYDDDKSRRGVMKVNKKDGNWELFKGK